DRLDWLEATRSGDPIIIRDAQLKILERRAAATSGKTPSTSAAATDGRTRSPFSTTPFGADKTPSVVPVSGDQVASEEDPTSNVDTSLSLDEFCCRYTSEDNESFSKIMEKVNRKRRDRYSHLLQGELEETVKTIEDERRDRITDGYGTSGQPLATLDGWKYTAKNLLMYNPADRGEVPLTEEERAERLKGLTKEIDKSNTRFQGKSIADSKPTKEEQAASFLYTPVPGTTPAGASWPFGDRQAEKLKKYDLEDLRKTPNAFFAESEQISENGYSFVKTPSPAPGVDGSPFMTWGAIEGTPLRLDLEETPVGNGGSIDGPHFSIPLPPSRDVKAHSLSREATRRLRERSKMYRKPPLPSPARGCSASPSVRNLSPAAQKFVRNAIAKTSSSVDENLRASYRGTSPAVSTPRERSLSRFSRDGSLASRSPSVRQDSASPW
ncbi:protein DGCR14-like, partial [Phalaenopsis equestris]|uniref:protein DGCR14-like n=1 Tax=Phalaenopsis equestris TaxID=78828 RepID=UPI0009E201A3